MDSWTRGIVDSDGLLNMNIILEFLQSWTHGPHGHGAMDSVMHPWTHVHGT